MNISTKTRFGFSMALMCVAFIALTAGQSWASGRSELGQQIAKKIASSNTDNFAHAARRVDPPKVTSPPPVQITPPVVPQQSLNNANQMTKQTGTPFNPVAAPQAKAVDDGAALRRQQEQANQKQIDSSRQQQLDAQKRSDEQSVREARQADQTKIDEKARADKVQADNNRWIQVRADEAKRANEKRILDQKRIEETKQADADRAQRAKQDQDHRNANNAKKPENSIRLNKQLASQQQMNEPGRSFAGPDTKDAFKDRTRVQNVHGGKSTNWSKKSSSSHTAPDGTQFETHWVENSTTGKRVEYKTIIKKTDK